MDYKCDRCGNSLEDGIYIGDYIAGIVENIDHSVCIDLCEDCSNEIRRIVNEWWNSIEFVGSCEVCGKFIKDGDRYYQWEDSVITCSECGGPKE